MKILIPTAKEMKQQSKKYKYTNIAEKSQVILDNILNYSSEELAKAYKIKSEQAEKEHSRWINLYEKRAELFEAFYLFDGLMYRNINRFKCSKEEYDYLQANVFITSSFYGIININEKIAEHRLDFLQNIKVNNSSLKNYWRDDYDKFARGETIISLLSSEFEEVFSKEIRDRFYKVEFFEEKDGKLKKHSTISKKARGKFLSALAKHNVTSIEQIKKLKFDDFVFNGELSSEYNFVFVMERGE